jgi:hypothetical protein
MIGYLLCFVVGACVGAVFMGWFTTIPASEDADIGSSDDAMGPRPRYQPKEMR